MTHQSELHVENEGDVMNDAATTEQDNDIARPHCSHCREPYTSVDAGRHTEPINCDVCYRCTGMPACYTCGHMYCACEVHKY